MGNGYEYDAKIGLVRQQWQEFYVGLQESYERCPFYDAVLPVKVTTKSGDYYLKTRNAQNVLDYFRKTDKDDGCLDGFISPDAVVNGKKTIPAYFIPNKEYKHLYDYMKTVPLESIGSKYNIDILKGEPRELFEEFVTVSYYNGWRAGILERVFDKFSSVTSGPVIFSLMPNDRLVRGGTLFFQTSHHAEKMGFDSPFFYTINLLTKVGDYLDEGEIVATAEHESIHGAIFKRLWKREPQIVEEKDGSKLVNHSSMVNAFKTYLASANDAKIKRDVGNEILDFVLPPNGETGLVEEAMVIGYQIYINPDVKKYYVSDVEKAVDVCEKQSKVEMDYGRLVYYGAYSAVLSERLGMADASEKISDSVLGKRPDMKYAFDKSKIVFGLAFDTLAKDGSFGVQSSSPHR